MSDDTEFRGKTLLAGISYLDGNGQVVSRIQVHGKITRIDGLGIFIAKPDGEEFSLPPDPGSLQRAKPGVYRLRGTGETVKNPDFICTWAVSAGQAD